MSMLSIWTDKKGKRLKMKKKQYSKDELNLYLLADMIVDFTCAIRDGYRDYATTVKTGIEKLSNEFNYEN